MLSISSQPIPGSNGIWFYLHSGNKKIAQALLSGVDGIPERRNLWGVQAFPPGHGSGTLMIGFIAAYADFYGLDLVLRAEPLNGNGMPAPALLHWYRAWGWRGRRPILIRVPYHRAARTIRSLHIAGSHLEICFCKIPVRSQKSAAQLVSLLNASPAQFPDSHFILHHG